MYKYKIFAHFSLKIGIFLSILVGETSKDGCISRNSSKDHYIWEDTGGDIESENEHGSSGMEENTEDNWELPGEISESDSQIEEANDGHKKREKYIK